MSGIGRKKMREEKLLRFQIYLNVLQKLFLAIDYLTGRVGKIEHVRKETKLFVFL